MPYEIYWKVKNEGQIAKDRNCLRGTIFPGERERKEKSNFSGAHYVECFIVKDDICVARDLIEVPISTLT